MANPAKQFQIIRKVEGYFNPIALKTAKTP